MNATVLKILAALFMLCDHAGIVLYRDAIMYSGTAMAQDLLLLRGIGRMAFPIFAFLIAEGCVHTKDIKKYIARLFVFGFLSEIPFDLFRSLNHRNSPLALIDTTAQNVMFTLALGALAIYFWQKSYEDKYEHTLWRCAAVATLPAAMLINCDYRHIGVLAILLPYIVRPKKQGDPDAHVPGSKLGQALACMLPMMYYFLTTSLGWRQYIIFGALALILLYNGKPGPRLRRYSFYAFYPIHLLALFGVMYFIVNYYFSITFWW